MTRFKNCQSTHYFELTSWPSSSVPIMSLTEERKKKQDAQQTKAFARWMSTQLAKSDTLPPQYADLAQLEDNFFPSLTDGIVLCELAQVLTQTRARYSAKVTTEVFQQQNIGLALDTFDHDGCDLVNIHTTTINKGDPKALLGLCWQLIQHYVLASKFAEETKEEPAEEPVQVETTTPTEKPRVELKSPSKIPRKGKNTMTINLADVKNHIIEFVNTQNATLSPEIRARVVALSQSSNDMLHCTDLSWKNPDLLFGLVLALHCPKDGENSAEEVIAMITNGQDDISNVDLFENILLFAKENMNIPKLLDGSDIVESVDVNTNVTYLSYYIQYQYSKPKPIDSKPIIAPAPVEEPKIVETVQSVLEEPKVIVEEENKVQLAQVTIDFVIPFDENAYLVKENDILNCTGDKIAELAALKKNITDNNLVDENDNDKVKEIRAQQQARNIQHIKRITTLIALLQQQQDNLEASSKNEAALQEALHKPTVDHTPTTAVTPEVVDDYAQKAKQEQLIKDLQQQLEDLKQKVAEKAPESSEKAATHASLQQKPEEQKPDMNLYLIIALIIAILAFLAK